MAADRVGRALDVFVLVASLAVVTSTAHADATTAPEPRSSDDRTRASRSFEEARSAFERRDYAAAAAAFEQAATLVPHPATWLNASEAWELRGDWPRAAEDCDQALHVRGIDANLRAEAEARLARAQPHVATLEMRGDRVLAIRVDGSEAQTLPRKRRLKPGAHRVAVVEVTTGRERIEELDLAAGSSRVIDLAPFPPALSKENQSTPPASPAGPPLGALVAFGLAGAFGVVATVAGVNTLDAQRDFDEKPSEDARDRFNRGRTITNVAIGGAIVAAAAGIAIWLVVPRKPSSTTSARRSFANPSWPTSWSIPF